MASPAHALVEIVATPSFERDIKQYRKQFRSVDSVVFSLLVEELQPNPGCGWPIPGWASRVYKIRCANKDVVAGKSGGFRIIYEWHEGENRLWLLRLYMHHDMADIPTRKLRKREKAPASPKHAGHRVRALSLLFLASA
jgi:mRNA-degrading endonuclease RelE of RelBE toxin-antitoxin system